MPLSGEPQKEETEEKAQGTPEITEKEKLIERTSQQKKAGKGILPGQLTPRRKAMSMRKSLFSLLGLLALATPTQAGIIVTNESMYDAGGGLTTFTYSVNIAQDDGIKFGDFFRVNDFAGYVPGSILAPAGWSASVQLVSPLLPPNVVLTWGDEASLFNLIFVYTGPTTLFGPQAINGFSADTIFNQDSTRLKDFVGRNTKSLGPATGTFVDSVGSLIVPTNPVPEPSTVGLMALGLALSGIPWMKRSK